MNTHHPRGARLLTLLGLGCAALAATACSSPPPPVVMTDNQCVGVADALKTLEKGDPLPRVVQVLGKPDRVYRVTAPFGKKYDVIEYATGDSSCAKVLLNAVQKLTIVFDEHGGMVGSGRDAYTRLQRATAVRVSGVPLSFDQMGEQ